MAKQKLTPAEQAAIDRAVEEHQKKVKAAELDAAIRNAVLDAERKQPGKTGY